MNAIHQILTESKKDLKDFLGWTLINSSDYWDREELLFYPKCKSDYRPIDENDTRDIRLENVFYTIDEVIEKLTEYKEYSIDYMGRITIFSHKGKNKKVYITQDVIKDKKRLIETYCMGQDSIASYNKSCLMKDINLLELYGKETYELNIHEENIHLYFKPQFNYLTTKDNK